MLALESSRVIGLRLTKIAAGGTAALDEAHLMVNEKVNAAWQAGAIMMSGGTASALVSHYQEKVTANVGRLLAG